MKRFAVIVVFPLLLSAATREECSRMLEAFTPIENAYDAVVQSKVASPVSENVIRRFRQEGEKIYDVCKDKMSTTQWYMLGKKVRSEKVDLAKFHLASVQELTDYAITHPPVINEIRCGTIRPGIHPLPRK